MERIFRLMENRYGAKWPDSFGGIERERMRQAWGEELADYAGDEIKRGLDASVARNPVWPPTVGEFMALCRPLPDARADFAEAREQMALRMRGEGADRWSRPQVYWAAVAIGNYDLQTFGWEPLRHRWENALAGAKSSPVPEWKAPLYALPKPGEQGVTREDARERISGVAVGLTLKNGRGGDAAEPGKAWAVELLRREAAGESIALVAEGVWRDVLGFGHGISAGDALRSLESRAA
ncbi:hypothetical protein [Thiobacillus denitrificans]|uniref:Uncharacterized protein n=1 Tax=Thiobacillus denitrificans TaxID=36861 RepID=A0A106BHT3_THIDE|nr:hypothetical protein [Thiobacillus denitrificans]KVW92625.1 hypothetical protein ABW22_15710 [Thiobacillus denitrificans]